MPGLCIVAYISMLERIVTDLVEARNPIGPKRIKLKNVGSWSRRLGCKISDFEAAELRILFELRNCYAHAFGRASGQKQLDELIGFRMLLNDGDGVDWKGRTVLPYYEVAADGTVVVLPQATQRARANSLHILTRLGFD